MRRLHQLAKELNLSSRALIKLLRRLGFDVTSPMSPVSDSMTKTCKKQLEQDKEALKLKDIEKKKLQARVQSLTHETRRERRLREEKRAEKKVRETITKIKKKERTKKYKVRPSKEVMEGKEGPVKVRVSEFTSVRELASLLSVEALSLISKCLDLGLMVTINQRLDFDTIATIADEYGYEAELISAYAEEAEEEIEIPKELEPRAPIVTIMGHVDHGKTALLDYIRHTKVIESESGGITQHIGAYKVKFKDKSITFIDTPGHKAFTAMRARGARVTDIVVLVIAADDGVMPQTIEAINHARDAGTPIMIAINKIDLPNVDPERVEKQLLDYNLVTEKHGGEALCSHVSAKTGEGVNDLLETILMQAELLELAATVTGEAKGTIIEAMIDRGKGPVATAIISRGTLEKGDSFVAGKVGGKVRAMYDEWGKHKAKALPSDPVQVVGFDTLPHVGDTLRVFEDEKLARVISKERKESAKGSLGKEKRAATLETFEKELEATKIKEFKLIIKGDTAGSVEALSDSVEHLTGEGVVCNVIHRGVGEINESDILLAEASDAIIIGYHIKENPEAEALAPKKSVQIRIYNVIYEAIEDTKLAMQGLLPLQYEEREVGRAEVREVFKISGVGFVTGCYVLEGKILKNQKVKVKRDDEIVYEGNIKSLKRIKEDVKEVEAGFECGIAFEESIKLQPGDILEIYEVTEKDRIKVK